MLRCTILSDSPYPGEQQILIWGGANDLFAAASGFRYAAAQAEDGRGDWLPANISLIVREPANGMARNGDRLVWTITRSDALHFAELIDVLAVSEGPGHQYLDIDVLQGFGLRVKISKDEYPPEFSSGHAVAS